MNKIELSKAVAAKLGSSDAAAKAAVDAVVNSIADALTAGDSVTLVGFGTFGVKSVEAREGRNPATGETMTIPAHKSPYFKAGKSLKDAVGK